MKKIICRCFKTRISNSGAWSDVDRDGDLDLLIIRDGTNSLLINQLIDTGTPEFVDNSVASGLGKQFRAMGIRQSFPTSIMMEIPICISQTEVEQTFYMKTMDLDIFSPIANSVISDSSSESYGVVAGDFNNDGQMDLFVTNDGLDARNSLFINQGDLKFNDVTISSETSPSRGVTAFDYDNDGYLDLYIFKLWRT